MDSGQVFKDVLEIIKQIYTERRIGKIEAHWLTEQQLLELNIKHLNHNYHTDIITFDYSRGNRISGELFISTEMVKSNAAEHGCSVLKETQRVVAHGILHLLGFGDKSQEEAAVMRTKENEVIARL